MRVLYRVSGQEWLSKLTGETSPRELAYKQTMQVQRLILTFFWLDLQSIGKTIIVQKFQKIFKCIENETIFYYLLCFDLSLRNCCDSASVAVGVSIHLGRLSLKSLLRLIRLYGDQLALKQAHSMTCDKTVFINKALISN